MENTTHTSSEIARAMLARAGLRTPPYAVDLAPQECQECGGAGRVLDLPTTHPHAIDARCPKCHGCGDVILKCECCGERSAKVVLDLGAPSPAAFCTECATDTTYLDGVDYVVAFALKVTP